MPAIESVMHEKRVFVPDERMVRAAAIAGMAAYQALCAAAGRDRAGIQARLGRDTLAWQKPFTRLLGESNAPLYKWFEDGELNTSCNRLDRDLDG